MRTGARRTVVATLACVCVGNAALAEDDSGVHAFLSNVFGQAGQTAAPARRLAVTAPTSAPAFREVWHRQKIAYRPLTVRRQQLKTIVAVGPTKPGKVSIYEDPTLRYGDAVMTADGIRIFQGSRSWPYVKSDFVTLAKAHDLSRDTVKVLVALNNLPAG